MAAQWWVMLIVVGIIGAVIAYRGFVRARDRRDQDRRISGQKQGQAHSPEEEISQREDRRLAGMAAEDRAWEQASLQRHRESQERTPRGEILLPPERTAKRPSCRAGVAVPTRGRDACPHRGQAARPACGGSAM